MQKPNFCCFFSIPSASPLLSPERATLSETSLTTGRLAKDGGARAADDDGLGVGEDGGDVEAAGALDIHEERAGGGHKGLRAKPSVSCSVGSKLSVAVGGSYLELVLAGLSGSGRVEEIFSENLWQYRQHFHFAIDSLPDIGLFVYVQMARDIASVGPFATRTSRRFPTVGVSIPAE